MASVAIDDPLAGDVTSILLDGEEVLTQHTVESFDTDAGWVEVWRRGADGKYMLGLPPAYNPRTEFLRGKVEASFRA